MANECWWTITTISQKKKERNLLWNIFDLLTNKAFIHWDEIIGILQIMNTDFLKRKQRSLLLCAVGPHMHPKI